MSEIQKQFTEVRESLQSITECKDIIKQNTKEVKKIALSCEGTLKTIEVEFKKLQETVKNLQGFEKENYPEEIKLIEKNIQELKKYFESLKNLQIPTIQDSDNASNFDNKDIFLDSEKTSLKGLETKINIPTNNEKKKNSILGKIEQWDKQSDIPTKDIDIDALSKADLHTISTKLATVDIVNTFKKKNIDNWTKYIDKQKINIENKTKEIEKMEKDMLIISSAEYNKAFDGYTTNMTRSDQIELELNTLRTQEKNLLVEQASIDVAISKLKDETSIATAATTTVDGETKTIDNKETISILSQTDSKRFDKPIEISLKDGTKYNIQGTKTWYDAEIQTTTGSIEILNIEQKELIKPKGNIESSIQTMDTEYKKSISDYFDGQKDKSKNNKEKIDGEISIVNGEIERKKTIISAMEADYVGKIDTYLVEYATNSKIERPQIDANYKKENDELNKKLQEKNNKDIENLKVYQNGLTDEYKMYDGASTWVGKEYQKLNGKYTELGTTKGELEIQKKERETKMNIDMPISKKAFLKAQIKNLVGTLDNTNNKITLLENQLQSLNKQKQQFDIKKNYVGLLILDTEKAIQTKNNNLQIDQSQIDFDMTNVYLTQLRKIKEQLGKESDENNIYLKKIAEKIGETVKYESSEEERIVKNSAKVKKFEQDIKDMDDSKLGAEASKYEGLISQKTQALNEVNIEIGEKTKATETQTNKMQSLQALITNTEKDRLLYQSKAESLKKFLDDNNTFKPYVEDIFAAKEQIEK